MNLRSRESFGVMRNHAGRVNRRKMKEILIYHVFKQRPCVLKI